MSEVVVLLSSLLLADLQAGSPETRAGVAVLQEVQAAKADVMYDTAFPDPDDPNLIHLTIFVEDGAEQLALALRGLSGVHASYVKPAADLP
ncbi:MAG: hypothetical protein AAF739_05760 [Pseudomonadota bacterium]